MQKTKWKKKGKQIILSKTITLKTTVATRFKNDKCYIKDVKNLIYSSFCLNYISALAVSIQ